MYENSGNLRLMVVVRENDQKNSANNTARSSRYRQAVALSIFYNSAVTDRVQG